MRLVTGIPPHFVVAGRLPVEPGTRYAVASWPSVVILAGKKLRQPLACCASDPKHTKPRNSLEKYLHPFLQPDDSRVSRPMSLPPRWYQSGAQFLRLYRMLHTGAWPFSMPRLKVPGIV